MAFFKKKTWKDRVTEYPTRRTLTKSDGSTELVTVSRSEGNVSQEGDAFNAATMNDLESRVESGFDAVNNDLTDSSTGIGFKFGIDSNGNYGYIKAGADTVTPFNSKVLITPFTGPVMDVTAVHGYSCRYGSVTVTYKNLPSTNPDDYYVEITGIIFQCLGSDAYNSTNGPNVTVKPVIRSLTNDTITIDNVSAIMQFYNTVGGSYSSVRSRFTGNIYYIGSN